MGLPRGLAIRMKILHLVALAFVSHISRPRGLLLIAAGFLLASGVSALLLAVPQGLRNTATSTGRDDVAMILSAGALDEASSSIGAKELNLIRALPHVARDRDGEPMVAPQFIGMAKFDRPGEGPALVQVRGIDDKTWGVLGATVETLTRENAVPGGVWVGQFASSNVPELASGNSIRFRGAEWGISGALEAGGALWDSEIWADLPSVQAAYQSPSRWSTVLVRLERATDLELLRAELTKDPRLSAVRVIRQSDYYRLHAGWAADIMLAAALGVSVLLGLGAAIAVANSLSTSLEGRRREAATLRALGFTRGSLVLSTLLEVLIISTAVSCLVILCIAAFFDGRAFSTTSGGYTIYAELEVVGLSAVFVVTYSAVIGFIASALPARRLVRGQIIDGLRAD